MSPFEFASGCVKGNICSCVRPQPDTPFCLFAVVGGDFKLDTVGKKFNINITDIENVINDEADQLAVNLCPKSNLCQLQNWSGNHCEIRS